MASFFIFSLLFLLNFSTTVTSAIENNFTTFNIAPNPSPSPPPLPSLSVIARPPPAHLQETPQQLQFNSIIDSIVGAGDFSLLSQADPSIFPLTATLFVPVAGKSTTCPASYGAFLAGNSTSPATSADPLLFSYHIVPRRFTFTELRQFPNGARLPTLLPGKTLLITNNSAGNFSVNGALLTPPDLFQSSFVSVHGIGTVLDYDTFGDNFSSPENFLGLLFPTIPGNTSFRNSTGGTIRSSVGDSDASMARREHRLSAFWLSIIVAAVLDYLGLAMLAFVAIIWGIYQILYEY